MCNLDAFPPAQKQSIDALPTVTPEIVPQDSVSQAAYRHVKQHLQPAILLHSLRVFFYAQKLSARRTGDQEIAWHLNTRLPLLFTACIFHDFGACSLYDDGQYRFEVEGADAAVAFLNAQGIATHADIHEVWVAIACHTSPHIGERISMLAKIVRQAALSDFHRISGIPVITQPPDDDETLFVVAREVLEIEAQFQRGEIEKLLSDSVVAQTQREGGCRKAPGGSWPGDLLASAENELDGQGGVNQAF